MGTDGIHSADTSEQRRLHMRRVLDDVAALERMLDRGLFETGARRVGAEQEVVLVDDHWHAASVGPEVLERLADPRATTEIGRFNIEFNCTPAPFAGHVLRDLASELESLIGAAGRVAEGFGASVVLTGILPTLSLADLSLDHITPRDRYWRLNEVITSLRKGRYELRIKGIDELTLQHDSVMVEALNTSFQLHWQTDPDDFALSYNVAQAVAGPVLAAACNSPVLFGKRLWHESRIAIFEQAVDTRSEDKPAERDLLARVRFGERWVERSVLELYKEDVARFRVLFGAAEEEDPDAELEAGRIPRLRALQAHNSTVYRWNRPCYGITGDKPHLRIENRVLPSGPTVCDEVANAALWFGLMGELPSVYPDLTDRMDFADAKANFIGAAHYGLGAQMAWIDGRTPSTRDLLLDELIPAARRGLERFGVHAGDADKYLAIVRDRVESGNTGAQWMLRSVAQMKGMGTRAERLTSITAGIASRQRTGKPVHLWRPAELRESGHWKKNYLRVGQYMTTNLFTVHEEELIDLAASIMEWERVRHVPVEDDDHHLVGLVSYRDLLKLVADPKRNRDKPIAVGEMMRRAPATVTPETSTLEAIGLMKRLGVSCLPVVTREGKLAGVVTEHDFMKLAGQLLEEQLGTQGNNGTGGQDAPNAEEPDA
ncbi:MAG: CBS domain-containing protein [Phycisphaerales bacterium]